MSAQAEAAGVPGTEPSWPRKGGTHSKSPDCNAAIWQGESRTRAEQEHVLRLAERVLTPQGCAREPRAFRGQERFFLCVWVPLVGQRQCTSSVSNPNGTAGHVKAYGQECVTALPTTDLGYDCFCSQATDQSVIHSDCHAAVHVQEESGSLSRCLWYGGGATRLISM